MEHYCKPENGMKNDIKSNILKIIFINISLIFSSCYYDSEEELYPVIGTPKTNISYNADVFPILNSNCYVCHSNSANLGNISIEGYEKTKIYIDNGKLLGAIKHQTNFTPMPNGAAKLPQALISIIETWIQEGAKNN